MEGSEYQVSNVTTERQQAFDAEAYERQFAANREEYFAAQEQKQQRLGGLILRKAAERADQPGISRNIVEEVAVESGCGLVDAQLAFWTAHDRGQMRWNGDMFVPTDEGLRLIQR